ncbi:MAG: ABC transporter ATP-binding protein [Bacteroidota bacterium]
MQESILQVRNVSKTFKSGTKSLTVLDDVSFELEMGSASAIVGPSGSGKTTLLGLCAGLDLPSEGEINLLGHALTRMDEDDRAVLRSESVGFIFQSFHLIPTLTALENVLVPLELKSGHADRAPAEQLLTQVGLGERMEHYPSQLSGGEQQRVAIARAFINDPQILFADEPTGNLDTDTGADIERLLFELNEKLGTTLLLVTHDLTLAEKSDRILSIQRGAIVEDRVTSTIKLTR